MLKSRIVVSTEQEGPRTLLKESYYNAPYKVVHYGSPLFHSHLELIIMSSSPGVLDGDELDMTVHAREGSRLRLFTQSFNKLHPMRTGARQKMAVQLEAGSVFQYVPHPVTPFQDSVYQTVNEIRIAPDATLIWGDIIAAGRIHMGEAFRFTRLHSVTKIWRGDRLVLADNQLMAPKEQPLQDLLFFEGYTHQATLVYASPKGDALKAELDKILDGAYEEITFGFTQCADGMVMIRALGNDGEMLYDWLCTMGQLCWEYTLADTSAPLEETIPT